MHDILSNADYFQPVCTARHISARHYNHELPRIAGDVSHIVALLLCLGVILRESGTEGVSFKTHVIFLFVFSARFINIFLCQQPLLLIIYKVVLWSFTVKIVLLMSLRGGFSDKKDTLPVYLLLVPAFIVTIVFGTYSASDRGLVAEVLWFFSTHLESVAMLPQYIYCYRDGDNKSTVVLAYVLAMGGYRMIFGLGWLFNSFYAANGLDLDSFISGALGIIFFFDFLAFKVTKKSFLSSWCISVDDGLRDAEEAARQRVRSDSLSTMMDIWRGNETQLKELQALEDYAQDIGCVTIGSPLANKVGHGRKPAMDIFGKPVAEVVGKKRSQDELEMPTRSSPCGSQPSFSQDRIPNITGEGVVCAAMDEAAGAILRDAG